MEVITEIYPKESELNQKCLWIRMEKKGILLNLYSLQWCRAGHIHHIEGIQLLDRHRLYVPVSGSSEFPNELLWCNQSLWSGFNVKSWAA